MLTVRIISNDLSCWKLSLGMFLLHAFVIYDELRDLGEISENRIKSHYVFKTEIYKSLSFQCAYTLYKLRNVKARVNGAVSRTGISFCNGI